MVSEELNNTIEALKVENLSKWFGGVSVFQNIFFSLDIGERVAIIGPNGAGKTTLINVVSGVLTPSEGRVYVLGQDVTNQPLHKRGHVGLARSFQLNSIFPELDVLDNVMLALQGTQLSCLNILGSTVYPRSILAEAERLLSHSGLWEKKSIPAKILSHGEQRQLEIILTMMPGAKVLLLDEPSAGLSASETAVLIDVLRALPTTITILFSAHDLDLIFSLATRIMVLYRGSILADGTPEEIQADLRVQEIYLGGHIDGIA